MTQKKYHGKTWLGEHLGFQDHSDKWDDTPIGLTVGGGGERLIWRKDAIALRDMLIGILGLPPEPEPEPPVRFKVGDRVKLTGQGWSGAPGVPAVGDVVTILEVDPDVAHPYALFAGHWYVHAADSEYFERWGGELAPEPTIREQVDALAPGTRFTVPEGGEGVVYTKLARDGYVVSEGATRSGAPVLIEMSNHAISWGRSTDTIEVVE